MVDLVLGVLAFIMGASVGSFLNVAADRLPSGRSLVKPRSYCEGCDRPLKSLEMIPIISYLVLRGRCRVCGVSIPWRVVVVEVATGLLFIPIFTQYGFSLEFAVIAVAVSFLVLVTFIDIEHKLILNKMIYPAVLALLVIAPFWEELGFTRNFFGVFSMNEYAGSFLNSLVSGMGAFLVFFIMAMIYPAGMGGGDIKLAGALGLLLGYPGVLIAIYIGVFAGGLVAIVLLALRIKGRKDAIPFGPYLAMGGGAVLLAGPEMIAWYRDSAPGIFGA